METSIPFLNITINSFDFIRYPRRIRGNKLDKVSYRRYVSRNLTPEQSLFYDWFTYLLKMANDVEINYKQLYSLFSDILSNPQKAFDVYRRRGGMFPSPRTFERMEDIYNYLILNANIKSSVNINHYQILLNKYKLNKGEE